MKHLGKLYVAIECDDCGKHPAGVPTDTGHLRCEKCGQYGSEAENYCGKHDIDYSDIFPEDNHCPKCREERRRQEMIQEQATRDRRMEPY